jgi:uncharacterized protein (DUF952 family)
VICHIVSRTDWEQTAPGPYRAASLATEGFIHCSYRDQVARIANLFYRDQTDLIVLVIDPVKLTSPLRAEAVGGERFPHVYGPIDRLSVVAVQALERSADGDWILPAEK